LAVGIIGARNFGLLLREVVGVDFTKEMLAAAQVNVEKYHDDKLQSPIEFVEASIDSLEGLLTLEENAADVIISNGVFNLCLNKPAAFQTVFRLLRPGGRILLSDLCKVPEESPHAIVSCTVGDGWSS
jgi:arsenite methyltransferase